ncbi:MAG TPA: ArsR family transcriptional regulator [Anaerolineaceae bacterium]|nr:ArsR family transcriptional regulator [Anaerolineaceae bacterium]
MNMKPPNFEKKSSKILSVLGNPFRIKILLAIGKGEACVCHLEAALNKRQAYISQHLMALRDAGLLKTRREGKYIFYRVSSHEVFELLTQAGLVAGLNQDEIPQVTDQAIVKKCVCPHCEEERIVNGET